MQYQILKTDRQAFGVLLGKGVDLRQSFAFSITPLIQSAWQLQMEIYDRVLKVCFEITMIEQADAVIEHPPFNTRWIYDGMAILRILKPKKSTYRELIEILINVITESSRSFPITIEMVNDI